MCGSARVRRMIGEEKEKYGWKKKLRRIIKREEDGENRWIPSDIRIIRSRRKTISIQIDEDLLLTVRAPLRMPDSAVRKFIGERTDWIEKNMRKMMERQEALKAEPEDILTAEELRGLAEEAAEYIPGRVAIYASLIGVSCGRITIRNQRTRWGSCSSAGNLNFNCLLMLMPPEIIDYVVVYELCHRLEMNHSPYFWAEVERVLPDYRKRRKWLRDNGEKIMRRISSPL